MPDCWFVVYRVGKREIWRLGCKCAIKNTRVQKKCDVGALQEDYVCLHRAIPFMPVAVCIAEQRETDRLLNRR